MTKSLKIILTIVSSLVLIGVGIYYFSPNIHTDNFAVLTESDPLFYSPYFDVEAFNAAVDNMSSAEKQLKDTAIENLLKDLQVYTSDYVELIQNHTLFPTDFLELLPRISILTENFLEKPTSLKARRLLRYYEKAHKKYQNDVVSMQVLLKEIDDHIPDNHPVYYFFTDSGTSLDITRHDFDLMHENSLALESDILYRRDCLLGKNSCETSVVSENSKEGSTLTKSTYPNSDFVSATLPFVENERIVAGPYLIDSSCWNDTDEVPIYSIYSKNYGTSMIMPKLAHENYYRLVSAEATDVISKEVLSRDLSFYNQPEGTTYECNNLTFYPELLAKDFIQSNQDLDTNMREQLLQNKFGLLAPAFEAVAYYTSLLEKSQRIGDDFTISPQFLFITRSAYSLTYLPFASSVWRIDETPMYMFSRETYNNINPPQQFKTLSDLLSEGWLKEDIKKAHLNQDELINSLIQD